METPQVQGQYAQAAARTTNESVDKQGAFLDDYLQQAKSGQNSVAAQQQQAGLNQGMRGMAAQAAAGGSNPMAQRAAMYGGAQMIGQASSQAAMMRAQEMQAAQQMKNQYLGNTTGLRFGQQGLQQGYDQAQAQAAMEAEQLRQAQQQADRSFGMDIASTALGVGGSLMMSDERAKVVVPPGRPEGMSDLEAPRLGPPARRRPPGRPEGMSDLEAPIVGDTLVVPSIEADPEMTRELARAGVYDLPTLEPLDGMSARELTRRNPLSDRPSPEGDATPRRAGETSGERLERSATRVTGLLRRHLAEGAPEMSVVAPGYDTSPSYRMGARRVGYEMPTGEVVSDQRLKARIDSDERDKVARGGDVGARDEEALEMAREVVPYRYEYRSGRGLPRGEQSGVMAQDLERSELGENLVDEGDDGALRVDTGQAALSALGVAGAQQRQLDRIQDEMAMLREYLGGRGRG